LGQPARPPSEAGGATGSAPAQLDNRARNSLRGMEAGAKSLSSTGSRATSDAVPCGRARYALRRPRAHDGLGRGCGVCDPPATLRISSSLTLSAWRREFLTRRLRASEWSLTWQSTGSRYAGTRTSLRAARGHLKIRDQPSGGAAPSAPDPVRAVGRVLPGGTRVGVIVLTGAAPEPLLRRRPGASAATGLRRRRRRAAPERSRLRRQIRTLPKPVIAMVAGYAIGGGQVLHGLRSHIAADNAFFGQTGPASRLRRRLDLLLAGWSATSGPRRSGSSAASTAPRRRCKWAS
jgi:hypothetical protein